ncbi:MAG: ATP-binding cassette domain-containing protein [Pseudomonadota bacterium]
MRFSPRETVILGGIFLAILGVIYAEAVILIQISNALSTEFGPELFTDVALRFALLVLSLVLKAFLIDLFLLFFTNRIGNDWRLFSRRPLTSSQLAEFANSMVVETNYTRTFFLTPLLAIVTEGLFIIVLIAVFWSEMQELLQIAPLALGVALYAVVFWKIMSFLGRRRLQMQNDMSQTLVGAVSGMTRRTSRNKALGYFASNRLLRLTVTLINGLHQSFVALIVVGAFLLLSLLGSSFMEVGLTSFEDLRNYAHESVFLLSIYQPAVKLIRGFSKVAQGRHSISFLGKLLNDERLLRDEVFAEIFTVAEREAAFEIAIDQEKYAEHYNSIAVSEVQIAKGQITRISGRNGSGKSTLLWALYRCLSAEHRVGLVSQSIQETSEEGSNSGLSGGEATFAEITDVLKDDLDLVILDEPMNNLDQGRVEEVISLLSNLAGRTVLIVDHTGRAPFQHEIEL